MALAVVSSGTHTPIGTTETTLVTDTTGKTYVFVIDLNAMVNGDELELKIKTKVLSAGTSRIAYQANYKHVQSVPNKYSVPVPANQEIVVTLTKLAGGNNAMPWALLSLD